MKRTKVTVNYGVTRATHIKFEFIRLDMGAEIEVDEGDDPDLVRRHALLELKQEVEDAADRCLLSLT